MYLRSVFIQKIKCFNQIKIHFQSNRQPHRDSFSNWNVILGNNGNGKTTILQAIAGCLMDLTTTEKMFHLDSWIQSQENTGRFSISVYQDIQDKATNHPYPGPWNISRSIYKAGYTITGFRPDKSYFFPTTKIIEPFFKDNEDNNKNIEMSDEDYENIYGMSYSTWHTGIDFLNRNAFIRQNNNGWVSCGYGAVHSTNCYYTPTDIDDPLQRRFLTLFKEGGTLYHGEDWLKELDRKALRHGAESLQARNLAEAKQAIEALLPETIIKIDDDIRFIQHGHEVKLNQLSDGYRSMFALSVDLLRWLELMRPDPNIPINEVSGVVLIDEVDAHLHPTWQRQVGFWLTKTFPNIQFIVTTHSPFVAMAAGKGALTVLEKKGDAVEANQNVPYIRGWTVDKVLSELFELTSLRDPETEGKLKRYQTLRFALQANQLSPEEATELNTLEADLDKQLGGNYALPDEQDLNQTLDFLAQALKQKRMAHA